jgi:hypothetical protein
LIDHEDLKDEKPYNVESETEAKRQKMKLVVTLPSPLLLLFTVRAEGRNGANESPLNALLSPGPLIPTRSFSG